MWAQQNRKHQQILLSNSRTPSPLTTTNPHLPHSPVLPNKPSPTPSPSPSPKTYYHSRYQLGPPLPPPPSLALFYARAKETFLTPNGPYELQVPSDVLSIFHLSNDSKNYSPQYGTYSQHPLRLSSSHPLFPAKPLAPPPDPAIFNELAHIIQLNLKQSLDRFVVATFNNVGTPRAHCGSVGGLTIGLAWRYLPPSPFHTSPTLLTSIPSSIPPLIASFTLGGPRWWRLIAFPGMWLGLTIFISAMYGVCLLSLIIA